MLMIVRAARHGHRMSGKLARLAQQEADQLSTQTNTVSGAAAAAEGCQRKYSKIDKKKKKKKSERLKRTGTEDS